MSDTVKPEGKEGETVAAQADKAAMAEASGNDLTDKSTSEAMASAVDVPYALWLATIATAVMASTCLLAVAGTYLLDQLLFFRGAGDSFGTDVYVRLAELSAFFGLLAVVAHFLRLRLEALRSAEFVITLPFRVVANPPGGDNHSKFECSCAVTLGIDKQEPIDALPNRQDALKHALDNAFVVAVTDPVIRFSKARMEQTLKVAAHHVLGEGVSGVVISDIKQRRVPLEERRKTEEKPTADQALAG